MLNSCLYFVKDLFDSIIRLLWLHCGHANRMLDKVNTGICVLKYRPDRGSFEVIYANVRATSILGYDPVGKDMEHTFPNASVQIPEYDFKTIAELYRDKLVSGIEVNRVLEFQTKLVGVRYFEQDCVVYGPNTLLVTFTDISSMYSASITDSLTGLYTRVYLEDQVRQAVLKTAREDPYTFIRLDLNKFKRINDEGSHLLGDRCLAIVAQRLNQVLRASDIIARIGGDEFACLLPGNISSNQFIIDRLDEALTFDIYDEDSHKTFPVSAAIGMTGIAEDDDYRTIDKRADRAQIRAKTTKDIEIEPT